MLLCSPLSVKPMRQLENPSLRAFICSSTMSSYVCSQKPGLCVYMEVEGDYAEPTTFVCFVVGKKGDVGFNVDHALGVAASISVMRSCKPVTWSLAAAWCVRGGSARDGTREGCAGQGEVEREGIEHGHGAVLALF